MFQMAQHRHAGGLWVTCFQGGDYLVVVEFEDRVSPASGGYQYVTVYAGQRVPNGLNASNDIVAMWMEFTRVLRDGVFVEFRGGSKTVYREE